jgi:uncharacterized heparinase superfamily protein
VSRWRSLGLKWRTVRHFKPQQILWRGYQRGLAKLCAKAAEPLHARLGKNVPATAPSIHFHPITDPSALLERVDEVLAGRFTFLNQTADYAQGVDWDASGFDRLWGFNLHYFDFGLDLALAFHATGKPTYAEAFIRLATDWERRVPFARHDGWHPYPGSLRLVNWIFAWHLFDKALGPQQGALAESMWRQLNYLGLHLERDVGGNHLIKNAKALAIGGAFFGDDRRLNQGLRLLEGQLQHQVLSDGGHFERSPMYHEQVLQDLCEVVWYLKATRGIQSNRLETAIRQMAEWLARMTMPDGEIPLFGDSALGIAPTPGSILALVNGLYATSYPARLHPFSEALVGVPATGMVEQLPGVELLPESGFLVARHQDQMFVLDCGPFAPDDLPAHGHCDALSFELCLGEERFIVDSGTYSYTGKWRSYFRGTAAHNTVGLPGREQTEIWGDFRAGDRARIVSRELKEQEAGWYFCASHDGYRPTIHRRHLWCVPGLFWLIEDELTENPNGASSLLHVHPNLNVTVRPEVALLDGVREALRVLPFGGSLRAIEGHYAPQFGAMEACMVLELPLLTNQRAGFLLVPHGRSLNLRVLDEAIEVQDGVTYYHLKPGMIMVRTQTVQDRDPPPV